MDSPYKRGLLTYGSRCALRHSVKSGTTVSRGGSVQRAKHAQMQLWVRSDYSSGEADYEGVEVDGKGWLERLVVSRQVM